jgi:phosphoglucosamine mutase
LPKISTLLSGSSLLSLQKYSKQSLDKNISASEFCLQGTDGIRREVKLSSSQEATSLTPQEVFLKHGFITEEFMEIYAYAHIMQLMSTGKVQTGENVVIGWDPRDPKGNYTSAVVRGVCKAGVNAMILGIVPTPLIPMYMIYKNACGGFMVTASHNPKDQNGIKIFSSFKGLKPLPHNDVILTRAVLEVKLSALNKLSLKGKCIASRREALELFYNFSLAPKNTWIPPELEKSLFKNITLVLDIANGSLSSIAEKIFQQIGFENVIEVNSKLNGDVNLKSGVADLEGETIITREMIEKGTGVFSKHLAIKKLLDLGHKYRTSVSRGDKRICGAIFDADGDRFYRLDYNPFKDALMVMNGDEAAYFQAKHLITSNPKRYKGSRFITTVESDFNTSAAVKNLGFLPALTPVGDKWILLKIALLTAEKLIRRAKKLKGRDILSSSILKKWQNILNKDSQNLLKLEKLESELNQFLEVKKGTTCNDRNDLFSIGSEETGHCITEGYLTLKNKSHVPVFFGNGVKSAINTFVATQILLGSKPPRAYFSNLTRPFCPGYKQTLYTYYVNKNLFYKNSQLWNQVKKSIYQEARSKGFSPRLTSFSAVSDMLYIALDLKSQQAAIFVRNSGTENKISVNLRGAMKSASNLKHIGKKCIKILLSSMKDFENHLCNLEGDVLNQLIHESVPKTKLKLKKSAEERVLSEMAKQDLIRLTKNGYALTTLGKWYLSTIKSNR